jgi:hypothetical protein
VDFSGRRSHTIFAGTTCITTLRRGEIDYGIIAKENVLSNTNTYLDGDETLTMGLAVK